MKAHAPRRSPHPRHGIRVHPREFVFIDRKSGKKRFVVKPTRDGGLPVEETSSLLAMHCVLRSQKPGDFRVMVAVGGGFMDRVLPRTKKLMAACSSALLPIQVTARQQEVLRGILQNLRNKEIAAGMNVAERTVKFHIAALLQKFHVPTRASLAEKVGDLLSTAEAPRGPVPRAFPTGAFRQPAAAAQSLKPALVRVAGQRHSG